MTSSLPNSIQNFARRYLIYSLANAANLQRWELKENSSCFLRVHKKTQIHLFNNYKWASNRYEWRHDSVLKTLMNNFVTIALERFRLPANIDRCDSLSQLLRSSRPQVPGLTNINQDLIMPSKKEIKLQLSSWHAPSRRIQKNPVAIKRLDIRISAVLSIVHVHISTWSS